MDAIGVAVLGLAILFNAGANILIKFGMDGQTTLMDAGAGQAMVRILSNPYAALGIASFGVAFVLYSAVLSRMDLSIAYPLMTGVGFVLVLAASVLFFREAVNLYRALGIGLIFLGIAFISLKG